MATRIVHLAHQKVALERFDPAPCGPTQARVASVCSLMSTGTEGIIYNRLFEPGTHWDKWVKYPMHVGYATIGRVTEVGSEAAGLRVGQRVAVREPHASESVVNAAACYPVPDGIADEDASWFALAKIAFHGALAAGHAIGQKIAIIGAGPLGQMSVRWASAGGVDLIAVIDPVASRLDLARRGGATHAIDKPVDLAKPPLLEASGGGGPDVVLDVTGHPGVLAPALALPRRYGKLIVLGDTGSPSEQRLTPDVVIRGVQIVGAHDGHNDDRWNNATIIPLFFRMLAAGRMSVANLVTHRFSPGDVVKAFELTRQRRPETMGVLFDWSAVA